MNAIITYDEIQNLIRKKSKVCPNFTAVDNKTLKIGYKPSMFIPEINVSVHVETISKDLINLSYDCSVAVTMIVSGAVKFLESAIPGGIKINTDSKRIEIYPESFEKMAKVYKYMSLSDIAFTDDAVNVAFEI